MASGGRQKVLTGRDGGLESGRPGLSGSVAGRAVSEASVKGGFMVNVGERGGFAKGKPKSEAKAQGKYKANDEDSCEAKTKARIVVDLSQIDGKLSGKPKTEASDKAKCEDGREASGKVDGKGSFEVDAKAHCQATGETIAFYKGISKYALSASRAAEHENDQLETQESTEEWQQEERTVFRKNHRPRSKTRRFQRIRPKSDRARIPEENGSPLKKQISESNPAHQKRGLDCFPEGNNSNLLIDVMERVSSAEEESEELRIRVDELERENAELEQARVSTERDLMDEIDWRTEELEKTEALVQKIRAAKRRAKQDLKNCQMLVENLRLENLKKTAELESSRTSVIVLRTGARRNKEELEKTLLLVENLRLENSRKAEELENSQSLVRHFKSEYLTVSEALDNSQSLVENLSTEIRAKVTELESSLIVIRNLQSENNGKTEALENSLLTIENLQLENLRCRETLRNCQSYVDRNLTGDNRNSTFPEWSRQSSERTFNAETQIPTFQTKPRRSAIDEDCEMTEELEVEPNLNDGKAAISEIPQSHSKPGDNSEIETRQSTDVAQIGFKLPEDQRLQSELSEVWKSPSKVQEIFNEMQGCQLRSGLSFSASESSEDDQQRLLSVVKSAPNVTDELTAICNQIQFLTFQNTGTSLKTEKMASGSEEEIHGNVLVSRESENLEECEENLGYRESESLRELQGSLVYREPECLEELQRTLENLESQMPRDVELCMSEEVLREAPKDFENRDSGEFVEPSMPESDQVRIEERSNQSASIDNHQNNHTVRLDHSQGRFLEEGAKNLDEGHASSEDLISGKAAGDRKTVENYSERRNYISTMIWLKTFEGKESRSGTINNPKKAELKGTSTDDGRGLYKLIDVYKEHLYNSRERLHAKTNEPRRFLQEKFQEKLLCQTTGKRVGKFGERSVQNGEKVLEEGGGNTFGKKLGQKFEKNAEEKREVVKFGDKSAEKFGDKSGAELTADSTQGEYDTALLWKKRYEELWTVAQPFKDLLSAFHSQRQLLEGRRNAGKAEIEKLSHEFAKVLNHEHERQRICQILQLRDQNETLKMELGLLRRIKTASTEVTRR